MVLGHRLTGMRQIYDRYSYLDEKRSALEVWEKESRTILRRKDG